MRDTGADNVTVISKASDTSTVQTNIAKSKAHSNFDMLNKSLKPMQ